MPPVARSAILAAALLLPAASRSAGQTQAFGFEVAYRAATTGAFTPVPAGGGITYTFGQPLEVQVYLRETSAGTTSWRPTAGCTAAGCG